MTKNDLQSYQNKLTELRNRITGDVNHLSDEAFTDEGGTNQTFADPADSGNEQVEHEFTLSLIQNQEHVLEEISDALSRIDEGTFGRCEECEKAIPKARLKAVPYARHCVDCARKIQESS